MHNSDSDVQDLQAPDEEKWRLAYFSQAFFPFYIILSLAFFTIYAFDSARYQERMELVDRSAVRVHSRYLIGVFNAVMADIQVLARQVQLMHSLSNRDHLFIAGVEEMLFAFSDRKADFLQARLLDEHGRERVRVNRTGGRTELVAKDQLQDKSNRYYVSNVQRMTPNAVYVSPFDLNIEYGKVELPFNPVIRFGMMLHAIDGKRIGMLVLNYAGRNLLSGLDGRELCVGCELHLLNSTGYWMVGPRYDDLWGFMWSKNRDRTFAIRHPALWRWMAPHGNGQKRFDGGLVTYATVEPVSSMAEIESVGTLFSPYDDVVGFKPYLDQWKLVVIRPAHVVADDLFLINKKFLFFYLVATILVVVGAFFFMRTRIRRLRAVWMEGLSQEVQDTTEAILRFALSGAPLQEQLDQALAQTLRLSWLREADAQGALFLQDDTESEKLRLVSAEGLPADVRSECARVPYGQCLCGEAASRKALVFSLSQEENAQTHFKREEDQSHYCMPIITSDGLIGVLSVHLKRSIVRSQAYERFLSLISGTLASVVERKRVDEALEQALEDVKHHRDKLAFERKFIENILVRIRSSDQFDPGVLRFLLAPVEKTAGDLLLSAQRPNGLQHILIGDFTGHGLPSAIGGPLVSDIFYSMTAKDLDLLEIIDEMNRKLTLKLPTGFYLTAGLIEVSMSEKRLRLFNAGLPEMLVVRAGRVATRIESRHLPLGIHELLMPEEAVQSITLDSGDRVYAYSDGVIEADDSKGVMFGQARLEEIVTQEPDERECLLEQVLEEVQEHQHGDEQADDITMLEIAF
ncbi:MAG: SpoIIE family protein phosphatase [Magnetococcales bacterium]|nr:SpoIIE family protein phosphatase [Magnetococcales bacterium]